MNTLTQFILARHSLSLHLTNSPIEGHQDDNDFHAQYEIIENEELKACHLKGLAISGSLFSLTTFTDVTFESCAFFASKFENCIFINCTFKDCSFEFMGLQHCEFQGSKFEECNWHATSLNKNKFYQSELGQLLNIINSEVNSIIDCDELDFITWEEILESEEFKNTIDVELDGEEETSAMSLEDLLLNMIQKVKAA